VECTVQALMVERSRAAQHVKCPVTMLPSALRGTLGVESIALPICLTYYSVFTYYYVFHLCRCDYNELLLIRNSITRKNGWYWRPPKFWVVSESIPQKQVVWESIAVKIENMQGNIWTSFFLFYAVWLSCYLISKINIKKRLVWGRSGEVQQGQALIIPIR